MQVKGKVKVVMPELVISDKFKKREFVLTTEGEYPQDVLFQLSQDKCSLGDMMQEGHEVTVHINIRGREWTNPQGEVKYFNTLEAWKLELHEQGAAAAQASQQETDDLPF